jgi:hypothetical protein
MLISVSIMLVVVGGVFSLLNPSQGFFQAQPEVADMQQRLRIAVGEMSDGLRNAGAGTYRGALSGPISSVLAPLMPYRAGNTLSDPQNGVFFRTDTITVVQVPGDAAESSVATPLATTTSDIAVTTGGGCPPGLPACGFQTGDRVLIFDSGGGFDTFTVTGIGDGNLLQHASNILSKTYPSGARLVEIAMDTFYLRSTPSTDTYDLMHYDGYRTDETLVDNVVALRFDYLGDPSPAAIVHDPADPVGPWTTYGPKPPMLGVDNPNDSWPVSENCTFTLAAGRQVPRLASLGAVSLVSLTQAQLTDGPWCPDGTSPNRFDADLLRVRTVRVTVRVQTGVKALRGTDTALFTRPGRGQDTPRLVADQEIRFDVTPRNVNLDR